MSSDRTHPQKSRIAQLETEIQAVRKQTQAQRQRIAQKCGHEFLALVDSEVNCKGVVTNIVQKLVFQDDKGNTIRCFQQSDLSQSAGEYYS